MKKAAEISYNWFSNLFNLPEFENNNFKTLIKDPNTKRELWINELCKLSKDSLMSLLNPFVLGGGDINSDFLIVGKESAFNINENCKETSEYIADEYIINTIKWFNSEDKYFGPYGSVNNKNHCSNTYKDYQYLFDTLFVNNKDSFLRKTYIIELNNIPRKSSNIKKFDINHKRIQFLKESIFPHFKNIIFACGNYLNEEDIKSIFEDVSNVDDKYNKSRYKLISYDTISGQKIIQIRQLSNSYSKQLYFEQIKELINLN